MLCKICSKVKSKYKCSTCYLPYCSSLCWKHHKSQSNCEAVQRVDKNVTPESRNIETKYFTEDTISIERLSRLGESEKIKKILKDKYLQRKIMAVENADNAEKAVFEAMKDPDFVNFVDECLKIVEDCKD